MPDVDLAPKEGAILIITDGQASKCMNIIRRCTPMRAAKCSAALPCAIHYAKLYSTHHISSILIQGFGKQWRVKKMILSLFHTHREDK